MSTYESRVPGPWFICAFPDRSTPLLGSRRGAICGSPGGFSRRIEQTNNLPRSSHESRMCPEFYVVSSPIVRWRSCSSLVLANGRFQRPDKLHNHCRSLHRGNEQRIRGNMPCFSMRRMLACTLFAKRGLAPSQTPSEMLDAGDETT